MTARYWNAGELSGKFHFRATTRKHSLRGAKKSGREESSPTWAEPTAVPVNVISVVSPAQNLTPSLSEWELSFNLTGLKLFLKGCMTSVGRQFKTLQGSERGKKKKNPTSTQPAQPIAETYKASLHCRKAPETGSVNHPSRQKTSQNL